MTTIKNDKMAVPARSSTVVDAKLSTRRGARMRASVLLSMILFIAAPACSGAATTNREPDMDVASLADYTTKLVFGDKDTAEPLPNIEFINATVQKNEQCYNGPNRFAGQFRITAYVRSSYSSDCRITFDEFYRHTVSPPKGKNILLLVVDLYASELPQSKKYRYTNALLRQEGYFKKSYRHCRLMVGRNEKGHRNLVVVQILANGPQLFDIDDDKQQECLVRGVLTGLGFEGAATLPFGFFATRSPDPKWIGYPSTLCDGQKYYCEGGVKYKEPFALLWSLRERGALSKVSEHHVMSRDNFRKMLNNDIETPYYANQFASHEE